VRWFAFDLVAEFFCRFEQGAEDALLAALELCERLG
jgi:hypothetical protein